jgi:hypothetical protein
MRHDTKIAIVLRDDLADWQKLNVTAFLASGVAARAPETIGQPYRDADGVGYLAIFGQPVLVFAGSGAAVSKAHRRALERNLSMAVYTEGMFRTGNDIDNRAVVASLRTALLEPVGIAVHGDRKAVDKALKDLKLHP